MDLAGDFPPDVPGSLEMGVAPDPLPVDSMVEELLGVKQGRGPYWGGVGSRVGVAGCLQSTMCVYSSIMVTLNPY